MSHLVTLSSSHKFKFIISKMRLYIEADAIALEYSMRGVAIREDPKGRPMTTWKTRDWEWTVLYVSVCMQSESKRKQ